MQDDFQKEYERLKGLAQEGRYAEILDFIGSEKTFPLNIWLDHLDDREIESAAEDRFFSLQWGGLRQGLASRVSELTKRGLIAGSAGLNAKGEGVSRIQSRLKEEYDTKFRPALRILELVPEDFLKNNNSSAYRRMVFLREMRDTLHHYAFQLGHLQDQMERLHKGL